MVYLSQGQLDKWRNYLLFGDVLTQVKFYQIIAIKLDSYSAFQKKRILQTESVIFVWENSEDPLSDIQYIQHRLLSLREKFCFAAVPTYLYTSTQLQQSLNSICSSQPTGQERISCHEISSEVCEWVADWWLYNSRTYNWAYCEVM